MFIPRSCLISIVIILGTPFALPALAVDEYRLDDGAKESAWGTSSAGTSDISFAWLNRFVVQTDREVIEAVRLSFGTDDLANSFNVPNGTPVTVYVWYDINQDGDPATSAMLAYGSGLVNHSGTNDFTTYDLVQPVTLSVGDSFFAGAIIDNLTNPSPPNFVRVGSLDEDGTDEPPGYPPNMHSWVAANNDGTPVDPNALDLAIMPVDLVENVFPLPSPGCGLSCTGDGNWLIRLNADSASGPGAPILSVSPQTIDFGLAPINVGAPQQFTTLFNTGSGLLTITGFSTPTPGGGFLANPFPPNSCGAPPINLGSGESCQLHYGFSPTQPGPHAEAITITSNTTGGPPPPIDLLGEGVDRLTGVAPPVVSFGDIQIGSTAVAALLVSNEDNGHASGQGFPIDVYGLSSVVSGPGLPPWLAIGPGTCGTFPFQLQYLQTCELEVRFTPPGAGTFSFPDTLEHDATGNAAFIVEGNGVPSAPPVLQIDPPPDPGTGNTEIDLGEVMQTTISPTQTVLLTNTGGSDLDYSISTSVISLIFNTVSIDCGADPNNLRLAAGGSCELGFTMSPGTGHLGAYDFNVHLISNAASSPDTIHLSGIVTELPVFHDRFQLTP